MRTLLAAYFSGERWSTIYTGCVNLLFAVIGAALVVRGNQFQRGVGWALIGLGALHAVAAAGYAVNLRRSVPRYEAFLAQDAAAFKREELTRMDGVVSRFTPIRLFYGGLFLAGATVATYGLARRGAAWRGVGLSLCLQALAALALETVDYGRALRYQRHLAGLDPGSARTDDERPSSLVAP